LKALMAVTQQSHRNLKKIKNKNETLFGALTVGGIIIGLPLAILSYYLSYAAVNKYQQRIRDKMAAQKARLVITKESVKNKIRKGRKKSRHP